MLIDVDSHVEITCHHSRHFITLSVEGVVVFIGYSLFKRHLYNLLLVHDTYSLAFLATILFVHLDSLAPAVRTGTCLLGVHAWPQHHQLLYHLAAFAGATGIGILASLTLAFRATSLTSVLEVNHFALVHVLQTNLDVS
jgi:hypothetical protein